MAATQRSSRQALRRLLTAAPARAGYYMPDFGDGGMDDDDDDEEDEEDDEFGCVVRRSAPAAATAHTVTHGLAACSFPVGYDVDGDDDDSDEEDSDEDEEDEPRAGKKSGACERAPAVRSGETSAPCASSAYSRAARVAIRRGHRGAACGR